VAPLEIGRESYIAAGSVITDPVPQRALGIGRGRQVIKPDWVAKRKMTKPKEAKAVKPGGRKLRLDG